MPFIPRTKYSPPPSPLPSAGDAAALRNLINHPGLYVILDILQRHAIDAEIQVYTAPAEMADAALTLKRVDQARAAWQMLDKVQVQIVNAVRDADDETAEVREHTQKVMHPGNDDLLSP